MGMSEIILPFICLRDKSKPQIETDTPFSRKSGYHAVVISARTLDSCTGSSQDVSLANIRRIDGRDLEGASVLTALRIVGRLVEA